VGPEWRNNTANVTTGDQGPGDQGPQRPVDDAGQTPTSYAAYNDPREPRRLSDDADHRHCREPRRLSVTSHAADSALQGSTAANAFRMRTLMQIELQKLQGPTAASSARRPT
jgi:hypothetical protein